MDKFLTSFDGCKIFYQKTGKENSPAIIFVHGIGQNQSVWKPYIRHLSNKYLCISFDLRGHGKSDYKKITVDNFADDIYKILKEENKEDAILIGYSLGTQILSRFWEKYPKMVNKLIFFGLFTPETVKTSQKYMLLPLLQSMRLLSKVFYAFGIRRSNFKYNDYTNMPYRSSWDRVFPLRDLSQMHVSAYIDTLAVIAKYKPPLARLDTQTLIIQPAEDYFISFQKCIDYIKDNKKVILDYVDSDHYLVRRKPEVCISKIEKFIQRGLEY